MKPLISILTATVCAACGAAGPSTPKIIELDRPFALRVSEVATTADAALQIGFDGVPGDSRCPKGEQCVRAGEATLRLWIQRGPGPRTPIELQTAPEDRQRQAVAGHELRLLRLDPSPVTGRGIDAAAYVATLSLTRRPAGAADR